MKLLLRNREVDLDDELDTMFACQHFSWDEYSRIKNSVSNVSDKITLAKFSKVWKNRFELDGNESFRNKIEEPNDFFDVVSDDKCIVSKLNNKNNLIIYLISHAGIEDRMLAPMASIPDRIKNLETDFDIIAVNENPFRFPESIYPSNLVLGCSDENNSFDKMCDAISNSITKNYKNVIVLGDSKHAGTALSISHRLSDVVTNTFIIHGQISYAWEDSGWVQTYLKYLEKRQFTFEKTGHLDDTRMNEISGAELYHIIKCYKFSKMNIDNRILSPFKYHDEYNSIKVDYIYNEYDVVFQPFIDWLKSKATGDIKYHKLQQRTHNPHFIKPYVERKILPDYISSIIS